MALNPKEKFDFHNSIRDFFLTQRKLPGFEAPFTLSYGWKPAPWVTLSSNLEKRQLPVPINPGTYGDWKTWFYEYLEPQVDLIAKETGVEVGVRTNKGSLLELNSLKFEVY